MISKETLDAVNRGVLNEEQYDEAIYHYSSLATNLKCHDEKYYLVWSDAYTTWQSLLVMKKMFDRHKELLNKK